MKKLLAMMLAMVMALSLSLTAFAEEYDITIWVAEEIADLTRQQIEDFNDENEDGITVYLTGDIDHHSARSIREDTDAIVQMKKPSVPLISGLR